MSKAVRCIRIDSKNQTIDEVYRVIPEATSFRKNEQLGQSHLTPLLFGEDSPSTEKPRERIVMLHYFNPDRHNAPNSVEWGYLYDETASARPGAQLREAVGEGLIVEYVTEPGQPYKERAAVDCTMSLEEVRKFIPEWTDGILCKVPEFTCMLSESFDNPGNYELKLRCESFDMLWDEYMVEPIITQHSTRSLAAKINNVEIQVICGTIDDLDQNARVHIFRTDDPTLHNIGAATMRAEKIPKWVKNRLENYFKKIWIDDLREVDRAKRKTEKQRRITILGTDAH